MEPCQAWFALALIGVGFGKARLLVRDLDRAIESCEGGWGRSRKCEYYWGLVIVDMLFVILLLVLLVKAL